MSEKEEKIAFLPKSSGKRRLFESPEEMEDLLARYVKNLEKNGEPATITGVCLFLGFDSKSTLDTYEKIPEFEGVVKRVKLYVESHYERRLFDKAPTGAIFALKNMGWSDKSQVDHVSTDGSMTPSRTTLDDFYGPED